MAGVMLTRTEWAVLGGVAACLLTLPPLLLVMAGGTPPPAHRDRPLPPLAPPPHVALAMAYDRPLFAPEPAEAGTAGDAPQLVGIIGRLGSDAVALVRAADGTTHSLKPGEGVDGWRLVSLSPDAAYFVRGNRKARVAVPGADAPDAGGDAGDADAPPETDQ